MFMYCDKCHRTTIAWSPYAKKPKDGNAWMVAMCPDFPHLEWPKIEIALNGLPTDYTFPLRRAG